MVTYLFMYSCVLAWQHVIVHMPWQTWWSQESFQDLSHYFHLVGSRDQSQVIRLDGKCLYLWGHLRGSKVFCFTDGKIKAPGAECWVSVPWLFQTQFNYRLTLDSGMMELIKHNCPCFKARWRVHMSPSGDSDGNILGGFRGGGAGLNT